MSFAHGFKKTATLTESIAKGLAGTIQAGKSIAKGVYDSGGHTIGDTLKMKGLKHISDAASHQGGLINAMKSAGGRDAVFSALGKAAPSLGMAGVYTGAAYKGYKKMTEPSPQDYYTY
jgi:hypothetical protein